MAQILIPINPAFDSQTWRQDLEGSNYRLKVVWNEWDGCFQLELYDLDESLICSQNILLGEVLFSGILDDRLPPGGFLLVDLTESGVQPTRFQHGSSAKLFYFESEAA